MAIATLDQYIAAPTQRVLIVKTASISTTSVSPTSTLAIAGNPGAGVQAGTSITAGVVPDSTTAGCPTINAFGGGATGYLTNVNFGGQVTSRLTLCDMLFKAGAYAFNAAQALASQPSYSTRVPGGTDFGGTEIWVEAVTAFTGNLSIAVTYTNQSGVAGRTTGTVATGFAPVVARMIQLPLQAGDTGVQKIESVTATVATAGTFNVLVLRRLWSGRVRVANDGDAHDFLKTGMPQVFASSALVVVSQPDSTGTGTFEIVAEIANA